MLLGGVNGGVSKGLCGNDMSESVSQQHDNFSKKLQDKFMLLGGVNGGLGKYYVANDMLESVSQQQDNIGVASLFGNFSVRT